jgi:hypothetical protein
MNIIFNKKLVLILLLSLFFIVYILILIVTINMFILMITDKYYLTIDNILKLVSSIFFLIVGWGFGLSCIKNILEKSENE